MSLRSGTRWYQRGLCKSRRGVARALCFCLALGLGLWALAYGEDARAGTGKLLTGPTPEVPNAEPGDVHLTLHFMAPPTQHQIDTAVEQLKRANRILCDVTDGQVRLSKITFTTGAMKVRDADVILYPTAGNGAWASHVGVFGTRDASPPVEYTAQLSDADLLVSNVRRAHVAVYGAWSADTPADLRLGQTSLRGDMMAHELGHFILGVWDQYPAIHLQCGWGPGFDGDRFATWASAHPVINRDWPLSEDFTQPATDDSREVNNDIMHGSEIVGPQFCVDADGLSPAQHEPLRWPSRPCLIDSDCIAPWPNGWGYSLSPPSGTPAFVHCGHPGNPTGDFPAFSEFSAARSHETFVTADGSTFGRIGNGGTATGVVYTQATEDLVLWGLLSDRDAARTPPPFNPVYANGWFTAAGYMLAATEILTQQENEYRVYAFFGPTPDLRRWVMVLGTDASVFGGAPGVFQEIANYEIVFLWDGTRWNVGTINGQPYDPSSPPYVILGSVTDVSDRPPGAQSDPTGLFASGDTQVSIRLYFTELEQDDWNDAWGNPAGSWPRLRARYGWMELPALIDGTPFKVDVPQLKSCAADQERVWNIFNSQTGRWEGSEQTHQTMRNYQGQALSSWERMDDALMRRWGYQILRPAGGKPKPVVEYLAGTTLCPDPDFQPFQPEAYEEVVLLLDRSGSMGADYELQRSRLDYAKVAAKTYLEELARRGSASGTPYKVGLLWFSNEVEVHPDRPPMRKLLPGDTCSTVGCAGDEIDVQTMVDFWLVPSGEPNETPIAEGCTYIGRALRKVRELFGPPTGLGRAVVMLSDGQDTSWSCPPWPGDADEIDHVAEGQSLIDEANVHFNTIAIGTATHGYYSHGLARQSNADVFPAVKRDELSPRFMASFAGLVGDSLAMDRERVAADYAPGDPASLREFLVEPGAEWMTIVISREFWYYKYYNWDPGFELRDPNGNLVLTHEDPSVRTSPATVPYVSKVVSVPNPEPGQWTLDLTQGGGSLYQRSYITVHIRNDAPRCTVTAAPQIVEEGRPVRITAQASWGVPLKNGSQATGFVRRPDESQVPLYFTFDEATGMHVATLQPEQLVGRGGYEVRVTCEGLEGAELRPAEVIGDPNVPSATHGAPHAFQRAASAHFFYDSTSWPELNPASDPDGDGIPSGEEPVGDTDGDGLIDALDDDADGDDILDRTDPAVGMPCYLPEEETLQTTCLPGPQLVKVPIPAECSGEIVSLDGIALPSPIPIDSTGIRLRPGYYEVEWTSTLGEVVTQGISLQLQESPVCCDSTQTLIEGSELVDHIRPCTEEAYCVLAYGGADTVETRGLGDWLFGGTGADHLTSGAGEDLVVGGDGADFIFGGHQGSLVAYGGNGADAIHALWSNSATLYGGFGADMLTGGNGPDWIVPGPESTYVAAGAGNDTVVLYDLCEAAPGEFLDGGMGNDTLIIPVPLAEITALGVVAFGFEEIVVDSGSTYLAECFQ